ncbi:MAG: RidA family protein [Candidatus Sericytochromatia bacterium]|nr:RidA family protein [Candidatus Tanganyikabacteria bacterium]
MERTRVSSGASWEPKLGYCRAVRAGNQIFVSGTIAIDADGHIVGPGDPYVQALHILRIIAHALEELGSSLSDVVRTRIYLANFNDLEEVGRAHRETFANFPPANTVIEVARLIEQAHRVEIEADAIVS